MISCVSRVLRFVAAAFALLAVGCGVVESGESETISIRTLRALYRGAPVAITQNLAIEGVVVSSDRDGEFYHKVVVEDSSGGIIILVDSDALYRLHRVGDRLHIECRGVTLGDFAGSLRLGAEGERYEVEPLSVARWREIYQTTGVAEQDPRRESTIGSISATDLSTRLVFSPVRFVEEGEQWAPNGRDTTRHIVDCLSPTDTLLLRLSGRSAFAKEVIPSGECSVVGVLDYRYDHYELLMACEGDVLPLNEN